MAARGARRRPRPTRASRAMRRPSSSSARTPTRWPPCASAIDELYQNSEYPTRTQTEEAFGKMFGEMLGDLKNAIYWIGGAVVVVAHLRRRQRHGHGHARAHDRGRRLEGDRFHDKGCVLFMVMAEAVLIAGLGGALGAIGCKVLFELYRHQPLHGRVPPVFLRTLERRLVGPVGLALDRLFERGLPGDPRGQFVGHRRTEEGDLARS